jgi:DNA repair protein RadA
MHISSRLREVTMEDIPDLTSDTLERLRKLNINSVYQSDDVHIL